MARHVVAKASEIPAGSRKLVEAAGRPIVVFNVGGRLYAISNRCPHAGGSLVHGKLDGLVQATVPGQYSYSRPGEILRCPWHGWEFDLATGRSWCDPDTVKVRAYRVDVEQGADLVAGEIGESTEAPRELETFEVTVEDDYIVVTM
jgi:nitrite reductase/ring-hydroxylating ferredoxin subunit